MLLILAEHEDDIKQGMETSAELVQTVLDTFEPVGFWGESATGPRAGQTPGVQATASPGLRQVSGGTGPLAPPRPANLGPFPPPGPPLVTNNLNG
jgi:hypothetical protein